MGRQRPASTRIEMNIKRLLEIVSLSAVVIGLSVLPGCGSGPPKPADPAAAREALDRALTAWMEGKSAESLQSDNPPIVVSDHVWSNGARLIKYEIEAGGRRAGADQSFQVVLWIDDSKAKDQGKGKDKNKGKERKEKIEYNVGTNPILTVVRPF
jgi:hypothetical protein